MQQGQVRVVAGTGLPVLEGVYDGGGKRIQASTGSAANKKTNFLWDVGFALPQLAFERNGNGADVRRYRYGLRRIAMIPDSGFVSYYIYDGLGSVVNLVSQTGDTTQWTWSYEPFGQIRTEQKAKGQQPTNFMKFTGEYLDPTGLYHLRARQYDPGVGRFLTRDPADQTVNESVISVYAYVSNRPTVMVDPSGEIFRFGQRSVAAVRRVLAPVSVPEPIHDAGSNAGFHHRQYGTCTRDFPDVDIRNGIELGLTLAGVGGARIVAGLVARIIPRAVAYTTRVAPIYWAKTKVIVRQIARVTRDEALRAAVRITLIVNDQVREYSDCLRELGGLVARRTPVDVLKLALTCVNALARSHGR